MSDDHHDEWDYLKSLGLHKDVRSLQDYETKVASNSDTLKEWLPRGPEVVPSIGVIKAAHLQMFHGVHPWAGELRRPNQAPDQSGDVLIGRGEGAPWQSVEPKLNELNREAQKWFKTAESLTEKAEAIAKYHSEFEKIHPFLDGNGRVGRSIMEGQMTQVFDVAPKNVPDKESYYQALQSAQERNDFRPLRELVLDSVGQRMNAEAERVDAGMQKSLQELESVLQQEKQQHQPKQKMGV